MTNGEKYDLLGKVTQVLVEHGDNKLLEHWESFIVDVETLLAFHRTMYGDSAAEPPQGILTADDVCYPEVEEVR